MQRTINRQKIDPRILDILDRHVKEPIRILLHAGCRRCRERLAVLGCPILYELPFIGGFCAEVYPDWVPHLSAGTFVRYIESDAVVTAQMNVVRPTIGASAANASGLTGRGVTIAFADTGIYPHDDFVKPANRILKFVDLVGDGMRPYDDNGHGTFVCGAAAGNGTASDGTYRGVAPEANIVMIKSMDAMGGGRSSDVLAAMQWVYDNREKYDIRVFSISLGAPAKGEAKEDSLVKGVEALWRAGVFVATAAGNSGPREGTIMSPGCAPSVLTVGALDDMRTVPHDDDRIAKFSSRGAADQKKPDIVTSGVNIHSVKADTDDLGLGRGTANGYVTMSGTSVATPIAAGAAALLIQRFPHLTPDRIKALLMETAYAMPGTAEEVGAGGMDLAKALERAGEEAREEARAG